MKSLVSTVNQKCRYANIIRVKKEPGKDMKPHLTIVSLITKRMKMINMSIVISYT